MTTLLRIALMTGIAFAGAAHAQPPDADGERGAPPRWSVGVAALVNDSPYAGEGTRVMPVPLIGYEGDRFFVRGISLGWQLVDDDAFELAAIGQFRFDGFDVSDLGREELAANGIDYRELEDRDLGFDLGLGITWRGRAGEIEAELLADASSTSGGEEISVEYGYPVDVAGGRLTPSIGATWMSSDMANYHYGTLDEEVARGVVDYKPGATTVAHAGVSYFRPLGERWILIGQARYSRLPDAIADSPLIERDTDGTASVFMGFSRGL